MKILIACAAIECFIPSMRGLVYPPNETVIIQPLGDGFIIQPIPRYNSRPLDLGPDLYTMQPYEPFKHFQPGLQPNE